MFCKMNENSVPRIRHKQRITFHNVAQKLKHNDIHLQRSLTLIARKTILFMVSDI